MSVMEMSLLEEAMLLAVQAHQGQVDKSGEEYIKHPLRVMNSLKPYGEVAMVVGVLHDVVEDTSITLKEVEEKFGKEVADGVDAVTHRDGENYFDYVKRAAAHSLGKLVKTADIHDNMLPERTKGRYLVGLQERYKKALDILK